MNADAAAQLLVIGIKVAEPDLAARLASILDGVPGLKVVPEDEACDLVVREPDIQDGGFSPPLTPRELDVIALLAEGLSNKEIAARLGISPGHGQIPRRAGNRQARCYGTNRCGRARSPARDHSPLAA